MREVQLRFDPGYSRRDHPIAASGRNRRVRPGDIGAAALGRWADFAPKTAVSKTMLEIIFLSVLCLSL
jgi:hypothetical protein